MIRSSLVFCALMLLAFAVLSYTAAITKNSTYDETLHVPAAWENLHGDYRVNPEHPPLWKYWCALPHLIWPINTGAGADAWKSISVNFVSEWNWAIEVLYHTPSNDADAIVNRARFMMMLVAVALGALLMGWAWRLAGPAAAMAAGALYCFDPNFLAHGSLVTNDVAMSLCFFAWLWALWHVGREATLKRIILLAVMCALAMTVKFSGLLLGPVTLLMLCLRAVSGPWPVCGKMLLTAPKRLAAALMICIFAGAVTYLSIWAVYGFRYAATPGGKDQLAWPALLENTEINEIYASHPGIPGSPAERANWHMSMGARALIFARDHHLLPEAVCFGILYVRANALVRSAFLMGHISEVGWWYYFPLAMLFKTPTATLAAFVIAAAVGWGSARKWWRNSAQQWLALVLIVPAAIYLLVMLAANLDLGIRHILEIYPPIYLGVGLAAGRLVRRGKYAPKIAGGILALLLAAESVTAWPNYIPFFNFPSGGWRGGLSLLGDSNLDWGQDLKSLGAWQKKHEDRKLYLLYFGTADPAYYGIRYTNLPGSYILGPLMEPPSTPGIIAASATAMQGIYLDKGEHRAYSWMLRAEPIDVLGGSIYLFEYPYGGKWKN